MKFELDILHEDNHLLVVNKPAVLATMGVQAHEQSLVTLAKSYIKRKYNKPGNVYLGVVSRLDAWVTGAIVLARTSKAAARLTKQFQNKTVEKNYLAIVPGPVKRKTATLENWLIKNDKLRRMVAVDASTQGAKRALLSYQVLDEVEIQNEVHSLLSIKLDTGRKHQIRVQLSQRGIPILGDRKYESKQVFPTGIALHAFRLEIDHPITGERMKFQCSPPKYWKWGRFPVSSQM